jgi:hypothetical protein
MVANHSDNSADVIAMSENALVSNIVDINGQNVTEFVAETSVSGFGDPDSNWNALFNGYATPIHGKI